MRLAPALAPLATASLLAASIVFPHLPRADVGPAPPRDPPEGPLRYEVRDAESGNLMPCKLTLRGVQGTPDPRLTRNDIGRQEGDAIVAYDRVMSLSGTGSVRLPTGTYDVYASRGPEWDLSIARQVRITEAGAMVRARLRHVVDTRGWLSADFHVHAAPSSDSHVPMQDRVYEFISDGVEMIVSTDHNVVSDYAPTIHELHAEKYLTSAAGDEMTTGGWGHFGAFPLPRDLEAAGHGAILVRGRSAKDFFQDVRKSAPDAIIDVHHPRIDSEIGYFTLGRFDPRADRSGRAGFSYDFDAVEVLNGYQDAERRSVDHVIDDWFALLAHGHIVTATGNSDTHHLDHNIGGYPRNYVRVRNDDPPSVNPREIARAVRWHQTFFTTGPFVRLTIGAGAIGDLVPVHGGKARAEIEVQAAPWVSVSRVILYVGGAEVRRFAVAANEERIRFRQTIDLDVRSDTFVVARVDGDRPLAPVVGDLRRFDVRPLALTNPVFLDADGNGRYDPPYRHGGH
jgi:hypothetical protein